MTSKQRVWGIKVNAAFFVGGAWKWHAFAAEGGNKHAAIIDKARELGATGWDFGNADVSEVQMVGWR